MGQTSVKAIIFDDGGGRLGPLTDLRAVFEVRTGALSTLDRLRHILAQSGIHVAGVWAPPELAPLVSERADVPCNVEGSLGASTAEVLLVSGRRLLPIAGLEKLAPGEVVRSEPSEDDPTGSLLAARLTSTDALAMLNDANEPGGLHVRNLDSSVLLLRPWDVIRHRDRAIDADIAILTAAAQPASAPAGAIFIGDRITLAPGARVYPGAVLDSESGPIYLDEHAVVRPGAIICGPAYVGKNSTILERAHIKSYTAIGPHCKVGGEIGGTLFQGYANKAHEGHLGDSWVGEWANFGAGTTNSNLLNTYGEVTSTAGPGMSRERTGLHFLGCIVGDHVKLAIMTRIMTGSLFGTGSMIAHANPPTLVNQFEWLTEERRQQYRLDRFMEVARAAMGRRKIEPTDAYVARLAALHAAGSGDLP